VLFNVLVALGAEEKAATTKAVDAAKADEGTTKTTRQALFARNDYAAPGYYNNFQHAGNNYNNDYQGKSYGGGGGGYYDRYNTNGGGGGYGSNGYNSNGGGGYGGSNGGYGGSSGGYGGSGGAAYNR
jgi:hypothetical protein